MATSLSVEQQQALAKSPGEPLEVVDEASQTRYILLREDQFARVRALLAGDDFDVRDTYAAQTSALSAAGWDDPDLDIYNNYDAHGK